MLAEQTRSGEGREGVKCVLLGRGASTEKVEQWLAGGRPVEGFIGFAIGRSIWWDALKGFLGRRARPRGGRRRRSPTTTCISSRSTRASRSTERWRHGGRCSRHAPARLAHVGRLAAMAMKMRQSLAQLEQEFRHETQLDRSRRRAPAPSRRACARASGRTSASSKRSSMRFWLLVLSLIATAVIVTVAMFETLYYLLG